MSISESMQQASINLIISKCILFPLFHNFLTGFGTHAASYKCWVVSMWDTETSFSSFMQKEENLRMKRVCWLVTTWQEGTEQNSYWNIIITASEWTPIMSSIVQPPFHAIGNVSLSFLSGVTGRSA
jgi:hypothetical protein